MQYKTCSKCGANLDPDERCDCGENSFQYEQPCTGDCVHCVPYGDCPKTKENEEVHYAKVF